LTLAALALVVFGAYDSYPSRTCFGYEGKTGTSGLGIAPSDMFLTSRT